MNLLVEAREAARRLASCVLGGKTRECGVGVKGYKAYAVVEDRWTLSVEFAGRDDLYHEAMRMVKADAVYHYWPTVGRGEREYLAVRQVFLNTVYRALAGAYRLPREVRLAVIDTARLGCRYHRVVPAIVYRGLVFTRSYYCAEIGEDELWEWMDSLEAAGDTGAVSLGVNDIYMMGRAVKLYRPIAACRRLSLAIRTGLDRAPRLGVLIVGDRQVHVLCLEGKRYGVALEPDLRDAETVLADYAGMPREEARKAAPLIASLSGAVRDMLS